MTEAPDHYVSVNLLVYSVKLNSCQAVKNRRRWGGVVLIIDAKNEGVAAWYASYRSVPLLEAPWTLLLPLATVDVALRKTGKY